MMGKLIASLRHPFWQAVVLLVLAYLLFTYGVEYLPPLLGFASAPVPKSVVVQFMLTALVGILIYVSENEEKWRRFKEPVVATMVDADKRWLRGAFLVLIPVLVGFVTYDQTRPKVSAPVQLRSIHPAPPGQITFRGKTTQLAGLENPLRDTGSLEEHYLEGRRVYYQNCLPCHGDLMDGEGHYASGFNPLPLSFTDAGTIAQLTESFVFWRIAKGGPGNSAMPVWEDFLTENEIWAVIIFLYEQTGWEPRRWEEGALEGGGGHD
jgi:hypothetical protein